MCDYIINVVICVPAHHILQFLLADINEPSREIMSICVLRKLILQTCLRSHPIGLDVWVLVRPFVYFHTLCVRTAKALARLRGCARSPEPSLVAFVISTIISWVGSFYFSNRGLFKADGKISGIWKFFPFLFSKVNCFYSKNHQERGINSYPSVQSVLYGSEAWNGWSVSTL